MGSTGITDGRNNCYFKQLGHFQWDVIGRELVWLFFLQSSQMKMVVVMVLGVTFQSDTWYICGHCKVSWPALVKRLNNEVDL